MSVLTLRAGRHDFIEPCLPSRTARPPLGSGWLHEIKYDGFRLMACRDARGVRLLTRRGWTQRFRLIAEAVASLHCSSCLIDGEAVACDNQGIPGFKLLVRDRKYGSAQLYAFDLLELDREDLRWDPIERRKLTLTRLLGKDRAGLLISQPIDAPADIAFQHVCQLGSEGICRRSSSRGPLEQRNVENPKRTAAATFRARSALGRAQTAVRAAARR
jgi:bifunctional non-homologous end joining protein LigD